MKFRTGFYASCLGGLIAAAVLAFAPSATAFDPLEFPAAVDALNTYSPDSIAPPTNDGAHDMAVGGGQHGVNFIGECTNKLGQCVNEGFSAQSGPSGENPQGRVSATASAGTTFMFKLRGPVICLDVELNEAYIGVMQTVDAAAFGFPKGQEFLVHVIDNGNPVNGTPPDAIANRGPEDIILPPDSGAAHPCGVDKNPLDVAPLERGNIVVRDVMPLP
jgi:hypothetical protein